MEIWKDIKGYEGRYQASEAGEIKSLFWVTAHGRKKQGRTLKQDMDKKGYRRVNLFKDNNHKLYLVSRLVAETFIPNHENKPEVNHIDGNPSNNRVNNLEWSTRQENIDHAIITGLTKSQIGEKNRMAKLTERQVRLIKHLKNCRPKMFTGEVGAIFNVERHTIGDIWRGRSWQNVIV